jgi:Sulfotransferase family
MSKANPKIIYIAGFERSGSTILDIMLGNMDNHFSVGELSFYPTNGIVDNEFCSCGSRVMDCSFWKGVTEQWNKERKLSIEKYNRIHWNNFRNKRLFNLIKNLNFPDKDFNLFIEDTRSLYNIIWSENGGRTIIDSSKSPYRMLLLKKAGFDPLVVHVVRQISGVLCSTQKLLKVDPTKGIEKELGNRKPLSVILTWLINNVLVKQFSSGLKRIMIPYENFIQSPESVLGRVAPLSGDYLALLNNNGPFDARHLVAGGRIRMEKEIFLQREMVTREKWKGSGFTAVLVNWLDKLKW